MITRSVGPEDAAALGALFERLAADDASKHFHPHPLTRAAAAGLSAADAGRKDLYLVAVEGEGLVGYAMLRGWDEGYDIPAFGVAVDPDGRGRGVARALLREAVRIARERGASAIMLKVHPDNDGARRLYESEGFRSVGLADDGIQTRYLLDLTGEAARD